MSNSVYKFNFDKYGNTSSITALQTGIALQGNNYTNKGSSFSKEECQNLGLEGALPPTPRTLSSQVKNSAIKVDDKQDDIEKYIFIRALFDRNVTLAHALIASNVQKYMGIIYTPTVGLACQRYSSIFRRANGIHFYPGNIDRAEEILKRYRDRDIRVAVVTDNQGILGIGDQGAGGIAICLGKLMLYTQGAGIAPWHCLPISLDVGTDNKDLLRDDDYLGWRHERLKGDDYLVFVQRFARAFKAVFPNALCQWEDFSKQNAFAIRDAYLHDLISFNDDIQGTGSITLAAILTAMKIKKSALKEQVFLVNGAGAGGIGVAEQIEQALLSEGLTEEEAIAKIYTTDSRGLVTTDRKLDAYKKKFAKDPSQLSWLSSADGSMEKIIANEKVTVLIGTSGQAGSFTKEIVELVHANTARPVILPLSNPTDYSEAAPVDIMSWTDNQALVATGSPFPPVVHDGKEKKISQCNNVFVFPGVGLGTIASGARDVLPSFFTAAAHAVSSQVTEEMMANGELLPRVSDLKSVSLAVSKAVGEDAIEKKVSSLCAFSEFQHNNEQKNMAELIENIRWEPEYLPLEDF